MVRDIHDLLADPKMYNTCWFWCRHHKRAERGDWSMAGGCKRIGPFVSEADCLTALIQLKKNRPND